MNSEVRTSRRSAGVVIVGGGECGAKAAMSLRKYGWSGAVTVFGANPIPAYERPPPPLQRRGGSSVHPLDD